MKRRDLMTVLGGAAIVAPVAARAQQRAMPVVGLLASGASGLDYAAVPGPENQGMIHQGLRETGYVGGINVAFEYRLDEGHYDRLPALAAELAGRKVDVIVTNGTQGALAAKNATSTIPIVFLVLATRSAPASSPVSLGPAAT